jgi:serine/arginine repetitive matrix protein 1
LDVLKPWITRAVVDLLGFEDEVVVDYAFGLLEDSTSVNLPLLFCVYDRKQS